MSWRLFTAMEYRAMESFRAKDHTFREREGEAEKAAQNSAQVK